MRTIFSIAFLAAAAMPAAAQAHARHTAAHDSAHAIVLTDAEHLALHQLLLGRWTGMAALHGVGHDTLQVRFENDSSHQQLMVRHSGGVSGFEIRGDSLRWKQNVSGSACVASTPVSALLQIAKSSTDKRAEINGTLACGKNESAFTLRKSGS